VYLRTARFLENKLTWGHEKIIYYPMKLSRNSSRLGIMLVGLALLSTLALAWFTPCHADVHNCAGDCAHSQCCGGHSMPLLSAANPAPVVRHFVSPYHAVEEQPTRNVFASSIFRPPRA
jgi:hypothetical protein